MKTTALARSRYYAVSCDLCGDRYVRDDGDGPPQHRCRLEWKLRRAMVFMMRSDGLTFAEIAKIMGVGVAAVRLADRAVCEAIQRSSNAFIARTRRAWDRRHAEVQVARMMAL